jgi:hypothetical protein
LPFLKYNVKGQGKFTNRANLQAAIGLFAGFERDNGNDEQVSRRLIPRTGHPVPQLPRPRRPPRPPARSPRSAGHPSPGPVATFRRPPARGGPTIHDCFPGGTSRPYIVGPPLAGGLRGVALRETRLHRRHERIVYSRATPCGWPAWRSHGLKLTPKRATPGGWPARGGPTIYGGSTSGTATSYRGGPRPGGWPARTRVAIPQKCMGAGIVPLRTVARPVARPPLN